MTNDGLAPETINLAYECISNHRAVNSIVAPINIDDDWLIEFEAHVEMPRDAADEGVTHTNVKALETVKLIFDSSYPFKAPQICLRRNFNRELPHLNPSKKGGYVLPCVSDLPIDELIHEPNGLEELINRIVIWLNDAATGELMNPAQGWEPIRRDEAKGSVRCNSNKLIGHAGRMGGQGAFYLPYEYSDEDVWGYSGKLGSIKDKAQQIKDAMSFPDLFKSIRYGKTELNKSIAMFIWAGSNVVVDRYMPETVEDIESLLNTADVYGCKTTLTARLKELEQALSKISFNPTNIDIALIFAVKRPYNLISQQTCYELICYSLTIKLSGKFVDIDAATIDPLGQIEELSSELLANVSGRGNNQQKSDTSLLFAGCGSLGSKVAVHLARAGFNNFKMSDRGVFRPHNNARYGLIWGTEVSYPKSVLLSHSLKELNCKATPVVSSLVEDLTQNPKKLLRNTNIIIDTTASHSVREAFANVPPSVLTGVLVRAEIYAEGLASVICIEGSNRQPRVDDITVQLYTIALDDPTLKSYIYQKDSMSRIPIGQSCGSYTMKMTDAQLSIHASLIADIMQDHLDDELPTDGGLWVITKTKDNPSIKVEFHKAWKFLTVNSSRVKSRWEVRVSAPVVEFIRKSSVRFKPNETGGALVGYISWGRRVVHITKLVEAPEDSTSRPSAFILGINGLKGQLIDIERDSGGTLTYIGTWHSHPQGGGPSQTDIDTLLELSKLRGFIPTVCLIYTNNEIIAV